jgi:hypothetical protein
VGGVISIIGVGANVPVSGGSASAVASLLGVIVKPDGGDKDSTGVKGERVDLRMGVLSVS